MMPEKWTKRSRPPSSGVMKPNPLSSENHLTVPVAMPCIDSTCCGAPSGCANYDRPVAGPDADKPMQFGTAGARATLRSRTGARFFPSAREHGARLPDLVGVAGGGVPRQPQRIALVARDHVDVEVEHRLPGGGPA